MEDNYNGFTIEDGDEEMANLSPWREWDDELDDEDEDDEN